MDRMKKIKRQLSMTLRGGRSADKTNGAPEQIGLDESGGGGGTDLGEVPTRAAPGEPRSGRGPLSSAPGRSTDHSCPPSLAPRCCLPAELPLRLVLFPFSFLHFLSFPCHLLHTLSVHLCPFPWLCAQASGGERVPCLLQLPQPSLCPSPALCTPLGLLVPAFPGPLATLPLPAFWPWASTSLSSPLEWGAPLGDYCPSTPIQPVSTCLNFPGPCLPLPEGLQAALGACVYMCDEGMCSAGEGGSWGSRPQLVCPPPPVLTTRDCT